MRLTITQAIGGAKEAIDVDQKVTDVEHLIDIDQGIGISTQNFWPSNEVIFCRISSSNFKGLC